MKIQQLLVKSITLSYIYVCEVYHKIASVNATLGDTAQAEMILIDEASKQSNIVL
jgi:hypothetical protein